jgi:hypothetical protein
MVDKLLAILRQHFNLYHSNCILDMLFNDSIDVKTFKNEVQKMKDAESNDIDEYDSVEK